MIRKLTTLAIAVFAFLTAPDIGVVRWILRGLGKPFHYEFVDPELIRSIPGLEEMTRFAAGTATLAVFRANPSEANRAA